MLNRASAAKHVSARASPVIGLICPRPIAYPVIGERHAARVAQPGEAIHQSRPPHEGKKGDAHVSERQPLISKQRVQKRRTPAVEQPVGCKPGHEAEGRQDAEHPRVKTWFFEDPVTDQQQARDEQRQRRASSTARDPPANSIYRAKAS